MRLSARDRLLVLAPHPDDETLGAGGLLQRAAAAGASSRVVFATDGDDNPWPQRVLERRLRIDDAARARWGARRRSESYTALDALGVPRSCAVFLGFPDQGLTRLLVSASDEVTRRLAAEIAEWTPTLIVMPSLRDRHPDHNALAVFVLGILDARVGRTRPAILTYVVHPLGAAPPADAWRLAVTREERARKRLAIEAHATQLVFHRRSYRRAVAGIEWFETTTAGRAAAHSTIAEAVIDDGVLRVALTARVSPPRTVLSVVGWDGALRPFALQAVSSPARRTLTVRDVRSGKSHVARALRTPGSIDVQLPRGLQCQRAFVRLATWPPWRDDGGWTCASARRPTSGEVSDGSIGRLDGVDVHRCRDSLERHRSARLQRNV